MIETEQILRNRYLELMKLCLVGMIYEDIPTRVFPIFGVTDPHPKGFVRKFREYGRDFPSQAHSIIGLLRMNNLQNCVEQVIREQIPGDFIETGVWRGGAVIFMRAILEAYQVRDRVVWAADSFEGLPKPDLKNFPDDAGWDNQAALLAVSLETVQKNFARYNLLDAQVRFLKGWFKDTLPSAPIEQLAILRLDGDLYQSTWEALSNLYPRLSVGGYIIIDDYVIHSCRKAVDRFREEQNISEPVQDIDGWAVFWRKGG
jgi:hypothetical protein